MEELKVSMSDGEPVPGTDEPDSDRSVPQRRKKLTAALAIASLILGLVSLFAWLQPWPICGLPLTIIGLVLGIAGRRSLRRKAAIAGIVLCITGLVLGIILSAPKRYLGVTGAACPPPELQPAGAFVPGTSEIPDGQYLFVEWWASHDRSPPGECRGFYDEPTYYYEGGGGRLAGSLWVRSAPGSMKGFFGNGHSQDGVGFCGAYSELSTITTFPFVAPDVFIPPAVFAVPGAGMSEGDIVIQSVDASGAIVAEVKGCTVWIEPGQSWRYQVDSIGLSGQLSTVYSLTNYGLLDESQIDLRGFQPGVIVPTATPLTCSHHQPPKTEGGTWDIEVAPDGKVWVATARGVARFNPVTESWTGYTSEDGLADDKVRSITIEPDGSVWFTMRDAGGVSYLDDGSWMHFTTDDGLISNNVRNVSIAPDGSIWFATFEGASHWNRETDTWTHFTEAEGLYDNWVTNILFTPDGKVWFDNYEAVTYLTPASSPDQEHAWQIYGQSQVIGTGRAITSADGKLWLGQAFFDPEGQQWVETVYQSIYVSGLAVDGGGGLWIATGRTEAIYISDPLSSPKLTWLYYGSSEGIVGDKIEAIALEADNIVWFGTEAGVFRCIIERGSE